MNVPGIGRLLRQSFALMALMTILLGLVYPLGMTGLLQVAAPRAANGSVVMLGQRAVGSTLIGQSFTDPGHFWSRPPTTGTVPYDGMNGAASNLAPTNPDWLASARAQRDRLVAAQPVERGAVPVDLVSGSASGLDPDISVASARWQVPRVARATGRSEASLQALVGQVAKPRWAGLLGEPTVNVLALNLALDTETSRAR